MHLSKRGEESSPWGAIFATVFGLVFLAMFIGIIVGLKSDNGLLTKDSAVQTGCWLSNTIKCSGGIFASMPSLCSLENLEDSVDTKKLATLTRDTWWMYKENTCDFGNAFDEVYPVYAFTPSEDIFLGNYFKILLENNRGKPVNEHIENSDYAYLEKNTQKNEQAICFDKKAFEGQDQNKLTLDSGNGPYYMMYYDDQLPENDGGDKILITNNPSFDAGLWKSYGLRTSAVVVLAAAIVALPVAGAGVVMYTGGGLTWSAVATGTALAAEAIGSTVIITGLGSIASGTGATFYLTADSDDSNCVYYNIFGEGGNPNEE